MGFNCWVFTKTVRVTICKKKMKTCYPVCFLKDITDEFDKSQPQKYIYNNVWYLVY